MHWLATNYMNLQRDLKRKRSPSSVEDSVIDEDKEEHCPKTDNSHPCIEPQQEDTDKDQGQEFQQSCYPIAAGFTEIVMSHQPSKSVNKIMRLTGLDAGNRMSSFTGPAALPSPTSIYSCDIKMDFSRDSKLEEEDETNPFLRGFDYDVKNQPPTPPTSPATAYYNILYHEYAKEIACPRKASPVYEYGRQPPPRGRYSALSSNALHTQQIRARAQEVSFVNLDSDSDEPSNQRASFISRVFRRSVSQPPPPPHPYQARISLVPEPLFPGRPSLPYPMSTVPCSHCSYPQGKALPPIPTSSVSVARTSQQIHELFTQARKAAGMLSRAERRRENLRRQIRVMQDGGQI